MTKSIILTTIVALSACLFAGQVAAEETHPSLLGADIYSFSTEQGPADKAAGHQVYSREALALIGTEAGERGYDFHRAETKADRAARQHSYNRGALAAIATEAGDWEIRSHGLTTGARCIGC